MRQIKEVTSLGMQLKTPLLLLLLAMCCHLAAAFNIDTRHAVFLRPPHSPPRRQDGLAVYFGYSMAFHRLENDDMWLFVGAPRDNVTNNDNPVPPGAVHRCVINNGQPLTDSCKPFIEMTPRTLTRLTPDRAKVQRDTDNWLGVTLEARRTSAGTKIVTCAHRFTVVYTVLNTTQASIGMCMHIDVSKLRDPTTATRMETPTLRDGDYYRYGFSQAGTSLHITEAGNVLLGVPGLRVNNTNVVGGAVINNPGCLFDDDKPLLTDKYTGYAVTSLRMISKSSSAANYDRAFNYAAGSPRFNWHGQVSIFGMDFYSDGSGCPAGKTAQELNGFQFGSYFGSALCSVDVNNDGFDDLLVGAPFYNQSRGDEGVVYLYLNDGQGRLVETPHVMLTGSSHIKSRFGTAIASLGDINLDSLNDVIIGAPYEHDGRGAAYIYLGEDSGLRDKYFQKLTPASVGQPNLAGFGRSFATGMDIDNNVYPDFAVSAVMSDTVVLVRSRPVHTVTAGIEFASAVIQWHLAGSCQRLLAIHGERICEGSVTPDSEQSFCLLFTIVFNYSTPGQDPTQHDSTSTAVRTILKGLSYELEMDAAFRQSSPTAERRGFLVERRVDARCQLNSTTTSSQISFSDSVLERSAIAEWIAVFPHIPKDIQTPVSFKLNFSALEPPEDKQETTSTGGSIQFNALTPVLDIFAPKSAVGQISFHKECGSDDACQPELSLLSRRVSPVVIGGQSTKSKVTVDLAVQNAGETAYSVWVDITLPELIHFSSVESSTATGSKPLVVCSLVQQSAGEFNASVTNETSTTVHVICDVVKPISNSTSTPFKLVFDAGNVDDLFSASVGDSAGDVDRVHEDRRLHLEARVGTHAAGFNDTRGPFPIIVPLGYSSELSVDCSKDHEMQYILTADKTIDLVDATSSTSGSSADSSRLKGVEHLLHKFYIKNEGPGSMPKVTVDILLPVVADTFGLITDYSVNMTHKDRRDVIIRVYNASLVSNNNNNIEDDVTAGSGLPPSTSTPLLQSRVLHLMCNPSMKTSCVVYRFVINTMRVGDSLEVTVNVTSRFAELANMTTLIEMMFTSQMVFMPTQLQLTLPFNQSTLDELAEGNQKTIQANTRLKRTQPPGVLPIWVIPVSIVGGMLALTVTVIILQKCGFFKRKQRERLMDEKRKSAMRYSALGDEDDVEGAGIDKVDDGDVDIEQQQQQQPDEKKTLLLDVPQHGKGAASLDDVDHHSQYDNDDISKLNAAAAYLEKV